MNETQSTTEETIDGVPISDITLGGKTIAEFITKGTHDRAVTFFGQIISGLLAEGVSEDEIVLILAEAIFMNLRLGCAQPVHDAMVSIVEEWQE